MQGVDFLMGIFIMTILIITFLNVVMFFFVVKFFLKILQSEKQMMQDLLDMDRMKRDISKKINDVIVNLVDNLKDEADEKEEKLPDVS